MTNRYLAGCVAGLLLALSACSDTPTAVDTSAADQKAIRDGETAWAADWASRNVDKIAAHYADNASLMAPDLPIMQGKEAIRNGLTQLLSDPNAMLNFTPATVEVSKDLGYTQGTYTMTMTNPKTKKVETEKGKYVTVYKKQADGSWKAIEDINNADSPAAPLIEKAEKAKARKAAPAPKKKKRK